MMFLIAMGGIVLPTILLIHPAFADGGCCQEFLPQPPNFGNREPALSVRTTPPAIVAGGNADIYMQFRLYDTKTNATIKYPNLFITIYKGLDPNAKPLLKDTFVSQNGLLTLKIKPQPGDVQIRANKDAFTNAWQADYGGTINVRGPVLLDGGLYRIDVSVLGIDYPQNLFADKDVKTFETLVHVGEEYHTNVKFEGGTYPITITSFNDIVQGFTFDAGTETFSWSTPFDWNGTLGLLAKNATAASTDNAATSIGTMPVVRQEAKLPLSLFGVGNYTEYNATVNGVPIASNAVAVDQTVESGNVIFHFVLHNDEILNIAKSNNYTATGSDNLHLMNFSLSFAPSVKTSSRITTTDKDNSNIAVLLNWTPRQLKALQNSTLEMEFVNNYDGSNSSGINDTRIHDDVKYDIRILDNHKESVFSASDQIAKGGAGNQTVRLSANGGYLVEITVKGIMRQGQPVDTTRNGVATGTVLVPEFPATLIVFLSTATAIGIVLIVQRLRKLDSTQSSRQDSPNDNS